MIFWSVHKMAVWLFPVLGAAMMVVYSPALKAQDSKNITYVVKRGDTLIYLASKYFRKKSDYKTVQRINRIKYPRRMSIGKRLSIPYRLLKYRSSSAKIAAFRGEVTVKRRGRLNKVSKGMALREGSLITTSASSFVTVRLEDGSRVSMPSNSRVSISRLRNILLTKSVDYEFAVENGQMRSKIVPFRKKSDRYRVKTPASVSAVRGTDYRTRVDGQTGTAFSETVEGAVSVSLGGKRLSKTNVLVSAGTGAAATANGELTKAELLSPPDLIGSGKTQSDKSLSFEITPRAQAVGHHLLVSSDAGFVDILSEQQGAGTSINIPSIPDGRYFVKATAISADGFEGMPAAFSFKRVLSTLSGSAEKADFGYRFKWDGEGNGKRIYRFQLVRGDQTLLPIVDETGLVDQMLTLSEMPDGTYYWRVGVSQFLDGEAFEKWTEFEKLTVSS